MRADPMKAGAKYVGLTLFVVLVVGTALRLYGLNNQSLWADEIWSIFMNRGRSFAEIIAAMRRTDVHPPGYQLLLDVVMRVFGDSPTAVRMLSVIPGSFAVLALHQLGRLLYEARTALIASVLLAVSSMAIYYSQETRSYSWLLLFSIVSSYYFARLFLPTERPGGKKEVVIYVALGAALIYTHYYGVLVIGTHAVVAGLRFAFGWRQNRASLMAFLVIAVAYVPWIPGVLSHLAIKQFWIERPTARTLLDYAAFAHSGQIAIAVAAASVCALAVFLSTAARLHSGRASQVNAAAPIAGWATVWLVLWVVLPIAAAYLKSILSTPIFTHRNLIICFPPIYLLTARAIVVVADSWTPQVARQRVALLAAISILLGGTALLFRTDFYDAPNRAQYREAVETVMKSGIPLEDSTIVATDLFFDYYLDRMRPGLRADVTGFQPEEFAAIRATLASRNSRYVWFLQGHARTGKIYIRDQLEANYTLLARRHLFLTDVSLFERR